MPTPTPTSTSMADSDDPPAKTILGVYELGRVLGRGATAKVWHGRHLPTGRAVAVKSIPRRALQRPGHAEQLLREVAALRRLRPHPHVVGLQEVLATSTHVHLVMDYARGGELFDLLAARGRLPDRLCRRYLAQLASAVAYCHSAGVFHRDLKLENLLLDGDNDLLVSDFGLSAVSESVYSPEKQMLKTLCGTPAYVAPEILAKKSYDGAKVDVWSCGVILFTLNACYLPFNDTNLMGLYTKIYRGEFRCPRWTSPDMKRLITRMLDSNPTTRISVEEVLSDPWVQKVELTRVVDMAHALGKEEDQEDDQGRELNAFDIISFSSGLDLTGMFGEEVERLERFVVGKEAGERLLEVVEEMGRKEGMGVVKGKGRRVLEVEGQGGKWYRVSARVKRLAGGMAVVEVERWGGAAGEVVWREKLWPALEKILVCSC